MFGDGLPIHPKQLLLPYFYLEPIQVHHLIPGRHKILNKFFLCIITRVHLRNGPEFGIGTEYEVGTCGRPFRCAGTAIATQVQFLVVGHRFPGGAHIQQVGKKVVGQLTRALGEDTVCGAVEVGIQGAHTAYQHC